MSVVLPGNKLPQQYRPVKNFYMYITVLKARVETADGINFEMSKINLSVLVVDISTLIPMAGYFNPHYFNLLKSL